MAKRKLQTLQYKGKKVYVHAELDEFYFVSFSKKGTKRFEIRKDDGEISQAGNPENIHNKRVGEE